MGQTSYLETNPIINRLIMNT